MNSYVLNYEDYSVYCNGEPLPMRLNIVNHSPDGFSWGYDGSGPAQLALAIMVHEYGDDLHKHPIHYQDLKRDLIAKLDPDKGARFTSRLIHKTVGNIQWAK